MNLLLQFIVILIRQFTDTTFQPVIINGTLLNIFEQFVSKLDLDSNSSNIMLTRDALDKLPADRTFSIVLRTTLLKLMDTLISILQSNEEAIACLTLENEELKNKPVKTIPNNNINGLLDQFMTKLNENQPMITALLETRDIVIRRPKCDFISEGFRANLIRCIDILILTLHDNEDTIARLTRENCELKKRRHVTNVSLPDVMTIPFTMYLV
jgi:hypothetical protein